MYAGGFGNKILTDWGFLQKRKKNSFGKKISARIPHSVCLKVGNVDRIAIWSGSLGLTRAHSDAFGWGIRSHFSHWVLWVFVPGGGTKTF